MACVRYRSKCRICRHKRAPEVVPVDSAVLVVEAVVGLSRKDERDCNTIYSTIVQKRTGVATGAGDESVVNDICTLCNYLEHTIIRSCLVATLHQRNAIELYVKAVFHNEHSSIDCRNGFL